jgi:hypothetical protein
MKTKCLSKCLLPVAAGGLMLVSGCVVEPNGTVGLQMPVVQFTPPVIIAPAPAVVVEPPVVEAPVMVPDTYVWDGYENVGIIGGQYYYLGPGDAWVVAEPWRLDRYHGWERGHPDWRDHAIRNDRYRRDAHGHEQPRRDARGKAPAAKKDDKKK